MKQRKLSADIIRSYIESDLLGLQKKTGVSEPLKIGVELELFPISENSINEIKPAQLYNGNNPIIPSLIKISEQYDKISKSRAFKINPNTDLTLVDKIPFSNGNSIFFEPGGQLEISTKPCLSLADLEHQIKFGQKILKEVTHLSGINFQQYGINPIKIKKLTNQLQKPRYIALENYLNSISKYGRKMMLKTCSMHINVDVGDEESIKAKRLIAANLLVPFTTAIFANSYKINKNRKPFKSYRSYIWQNMDNSRTGILSLHKPLQSLSIQDLVDEYYKFTINAPLIYMSEFGAQVLSKEMTLKYWMGNKINDAWPTVLDLKNHISLLFPEVRIQKGYLELRSIDSPPLEWQLSPICFYTGLLYDSKNLDTIIDLLKPLYPIYSVLYKESCYGLESKKIRDISKTLMGLSIEGFSRLPSSFKNEGYKEKLEHFNNKFLIHGKNFTD
ncbi:glutamate-cysteine ligase family protein [Winogradskyella sp. A3E31]|uniref:glutamate-cysteine ligase family protein n=1 Tax=Winogradskyella sp. A3E31 TaxID=3349637 RepID=UPI00398A778E